MNNSEVFEKLPVPKALARFIIPAVMSQLASLILNLTDAFFVGRTGDKFQISAMTITLPLIMTVNVISTVFGAGANANIAASLGAKDYEKTKRYSAFSMYSALIVTAVISALIAGMKAPLLRLLGASESSAGFCRGYVLWALHVSCIPSVFAHVMAQLFYAEGDTRPAGFGIAASGILNAILDPVFMFGFKMGIVGAGVATCLSNYCCAAYFLILYCRKRRKTVLSLHPKHFKAGDGVCKNVLMIGLPAGASMFLMNGVDFVRNTLIGLYGTQSDFAAWGVVQKLGNACTIIAIGVAMGERPLVAYNHAAGLRERTKALVRGAALVTGVYACLCFVMFQSAPQFFVRLFLPIPELMELAVSLLRVFAFSTFAIGYLELFNSIFQAMGQWKPALVSIAVGKVLLMAPAMILFVRFCGVPGIIAGQPFGDTATVVIMLILYLSMRKKADAAELQRPPESK